MIRCRGGFTTDLATLDRTCEKNGKMLDRPCKKIGKTLDRILSKTRVLKSIGLSSSPPGI
jgi:hypothetical protein